MTVRLCYAIFRMLWKSSHFSMSYPRTIRPSLGVPRTVVRFQCLHHLHPSLRQAGGGRSRMDTAFLPRPILQEVGTTMRLGKHACTSTTQGLSHFTTLPSRASSKPDTAR